MKDAQYEIENEEKIIQEKLVELKKLREIENKKCENDKEKDR